MLYIRRKRASKQKLKKGRHSEVNSDIQSANVFKQGSPDLQFSIFIGSSRTPKDAAAVKCYEAFSAPTRKFKCKKLEKLINGVYFNKIATLL